MDIHPQDLGPKWHTALVRARTPERRGRSAGGWITSGKAPTRKPLGLIGRFWTGGAKMDGAAATDGLAGMQPKIRPQSLALGIGGAVALTAGALILATGGPPEIAAVTVAEAAFIGSLGLLLPRFLFQRIHRNPLTPSEIEMLLPASRDDLERAYLTLAIDAAKQEVSPEVEREMRIALRALGEAIERLPQISSLPEAADTLRQQAASVRREAQNEPDHLTAESLERQAEALERRADAISRSDLLVRRASALRRELIAQTEALRAGLAGFYTGSVDIAGLTNLTQAVSGVATEAASVAAARQEVDAFLNTKTEPLAAPLRVRPGGG